MRELVTDWMSGVMRTCEAEEMVPCAHPYVDTLGHLAVPQPPQSPRWGAQETPHTHAVSKL